MYRDDDGDSASSWEEVCETEVKGAWDELPSRTDHLLFGSRKSNVSLSTYHPEQVQIFRLWQKYLENVSPLLKVTHTPTLQARIIDVVGDLSKIPPVLEALMFSIYCVSVLSLDENECMLSYGASRKALLAHYQYGCQQALLNCDFLRSKDRDCLTALFLYLVSQAHPNPLASLTLPGFHSARLRSSLACAYYRDRHEDCTTTGHQLRANLRQVYRIRSRDVSTALVVPTAPRRPYL